MKYIVRKQNKWHDNGIIHKVFNINIGTRYLDTKVLNY